MLDHLLAKLQVYHLVVLLNHLMMMIKKVVLLLLHQVRYLVT
jgi:hypothetical protein